MSTAPEPMTGVSDEVVEVAHQVAYESMRHDPAVWYEALGRAMREALEAAAPLLVADAVAERDAEIGVEL